jgi:heme/copper-type cytochrome/quinol oxidase subunit 3
MNRERAVLDASQLPTVVFGPRAPLWWGVVGLMVIEGMMFAIMAASYFYLRGGAMMWPPAGVVHPGVGITTLSLAVLLASMAPAYMASRAIAREDLQAARNWFAVTVLLGIAALALRATVMDRFTFQWNSHAYGSLVWTTAGLHTLHLISGVIENLLFTILLHRGPVEDKHLLDARLNSLYWYFVALSWVPFYVIFFLDPGLLELRAVVHP